MLEIKQTFQPETLVVCRNGQLDDEYYDRLWQQRKREVLRHAGHEAIQTILQIPLTVGSNILSLLSNSISQG